MELKLDSGVVSALERFFKQRIRDWQLCEDLAQETILRMYRNRDRFDGRDQRRWMYVIARRILIDRIRRSKIDPLCRAEAMAVDPSRDDARLTEAREEAEQIERAMFEVDLPDDQRRVLRLVAYGRSLPEVAAEMQCCLPTVKSRLRLAREKIRGCLDRKKAV